MIKSAHDHGFRLRPNETTLAAVDTLKATFPSNLDLETYFCPMCGSGFPSQNILTDHMHLVHSSEMIFAANSLQRMEYSCIHCDEKFNSSGELEEHSRIIHQAYRFARCTSCGLYGIAVVNGDYKCVHCGNVGGTSPTVQDTEQPALYLEQSTHNYHTIAGDGDEDHKHELRVPPLMIRLPKIKEEVEDIKEEYLIPDNPSLFLTTSLDPDLDKITPILFHTASGKVRYKCSECPRHFKTEHTLANHRRIHTGEAEYAPKQRPYSCTYCGKCFTQSNTLKQHTRIHTGEKPFRCGYCGRAFTVKDYLNKHITTHTGEKPFRCVYCNKAFSVKDYLTKHIRTHTGEKPYACSHCDKRFTQRSALTVHTTKLHPI